MEELYICILYRIISIIIFIIMLFISETMSFL